MDRIPAIVEDLFPRVLATDLARGGALLDAPPWQQRQMQQRPPLDLGAYINHEILARPARAQPDPAPFLSSLQDFDRYYSQAHSQLEPQYPRGWHAVDTVDRNRRRPRQPVPVYPDAPNQLPAAPSPPAPTASPISTPSLTERTTMMRPLAPPSSLETTTSSSPPRSHSTADTDATTGDSTTAGAVAIVAEAAATITTTTTDTTTTTTSTTTTTQLPSATSTSTTDTALPSPTPSQRSATEANTDKVSAAAAAEASESSASALKLLARLWAFDAAENPSTTEGYILEDADLEPWELQSWSAPAGLLPLDPLLIKPQGVIVRESFPPPPTIDEELSAYGVDLLNSEAQQMTTSSTTSSTDLQKDDDDDHDEGDSNLEDGDNEDEDDDEDDDDLDGDDNNDDESEQDNDSNDNEDDDDVDEDDSEDEDEESGIEETQIVEATDSSSSSSTTYTSSSSALAEALSVTDDSAISSTSSTSIFAEPLDAGGPKPLAEELGVTSTSTTTGWPEVGETNELTSSSTTEVEDDGRGIGNLDMATSSSTTTTTLSTSASSTSDTTSLGFEEGAEESGFSTSSSSSSALDADSGSSSSTELLSSTTTAPSTSTSHFEESSTTLLPSEEGEVDDTSTSTVDGAGVVASRSTSSATMTTTDSSTSSTGIESEDDGFSSTTTSSGSSSLSTTTLLDGSATTSTTSSTSEIDDEPTSTSLAELTNTESTSSATVSELIVGHSNGSSSSSSSSSAIYSAVGFSADSSSSTALEADGSMSTSTTWAAEESDEEATSTSTTTTWPEFMETTTTPARARPPPSLPTIRHTYMRDKSPLEALVAQKDMRMLAESVLKSEKYPVLRMVGMTLFVPTDAAFKGLPFDLAAVSTAAKADTAGPLAGWDEPPPCLGCQSMMRPHFAFKPPMQTASAQAKVLKDFEDLIMFHVVRRQIPPGMIEKRKELEMRTEMNGAMLPIKYSQGRLGSGLSGQTATAEVRVGGAQILEVVHCKNGFLYKLDRPLTPTFNNGAPDLLEYVSSQPDYSKLKYLLKHSGLFDGWISRAGPITVFLIKDDGWRVNGLPVPDCFFKALVRPANRDMLMKILRWVTVPGIWRRREIEESQWLMNAEAPALMVNHIYRPSDASGRSTDFRADRSGVSEVEIIGEAEGPQRGDEAADRLSAFSGNDDLIVLVEGKEVVEWNIPLHNGYGHVLSELPMRPDIDLTPILWDCLDFLCIECPIVTKYVLKWLDNGGLLPDVSNPKSYIIPNGVRPDWVCSNHRNWFPAGWELKEWKKYIETAKKFEERNESLRGRGRPDDTRHVQKLARDGWLTAAAKREKLLDQYEEARVHLKRIWAYYADPQNFVLGRKEDPSNLSGFLNSHRSLEIMPRVCEPRDRAYNRRHGYPQQKDENYLPQDDSDDVGMSYDDWKYITQWI